MPALIPPTASVHDSYLRAMEEHVAEGRGLPGDGSNVGQYIRQFGKIWAAPAEFQRFIDSLRAQEDENAPRPANYVPTTSLWWVDGDEYLGRLGIRHRLAPGRIGERNGHIGYDVRPSARRKGHATAMLAASLPIAARLGLDKVLVTCDDTNEASRRTIERNGGVPAERLDEKLRYWIFTSQS